MKTPPIDFEGNFGSQDPALQFTPEDTLIFSQYFQEQRKRRAAEAAAKEDVTEIEPVFRRKEAA